MIASLRAGSSSSSSALRARARGRRGFTLVELMVALVAGLIVSLAVVALSRDATYTFHQEMRTTAAEGSLRTALDRLRSDIQRASFMSTGNIQSDPHIPLDPRSTTRLPGGAAANATALAGLNYTAGGSAASTPLSQASGNAFKPDSIDITGNFTSSDSYVVTRLGVSPSCGLRLFLSMDSAATYRVLASKDPNETLRDMFQPVSGGQFLVRLADDLGRMQFAYGCAAQTAGYDTTNGAWVDLATDANLTYLQTAYGFVDGRITVNPVQTVRWEIRPLTKTDTTYAAVATDPGVGDGGVSPKYNLMREWVGSDNNPVGAAELIAEYAVDLEFAFTLDLGTNYDTTTPTPNFQTYAFGAKENSTYVTGNVLAAVPQRVRSVRVRVSTRAAQADRDNDMRLAYDGYTIRYCTQAGGCVDGGGTQWARVRTATTDVALPNQARFFY